MFEPLTVDNYDPSKPIYEMTSVTNGNITATAMTITTTPYEIAIQTPWFFFVKVDNE